MRAAAPGTGPAWALRRDRRVLVHVASATISDVGDQVWLVALAFTAAELLEPTAASIVVGAALVPRTLVMLLGGVVADRCDARRIMIAADVGRVAVLGVGVVALEAAPDVVVLAAVGVAFGVLEALHDPAAATFPRQLVVEEHLGRVAALRQLGRRGATIVGAPLGGLVLTAGGLAGAMLLDALTFALLALAVLAVRPRRPRARDASTRVRDAVGGAVRYLQRTPPARDLVLQLAGLNVFVSPVLAVGLALRVADEGWGPATLGGLLAAVGAGAALSTTLVLWRQPPDPLGVAQAALAVQAVALGVVGLAPLAGVWAAASVVGVTAGLASPLLSGAFQATIDPAHLGRVSAVLRITDDGLLPLSLVAFGAVASVVGLGVACGLCGGGMAAVVGAGASLRRRRGRTADQPG